jgi:mono/diheme cytochrome c family protein
MNTKKLVVWLALVVVGICSLASRSGGGAAVAHAEDRVSRGKYIVERVAMCQECHTPRTEDGTLDESRWLEGGPVPYRPTRAGTDWADVVPPIAGLPGFLEDRIVIELLTKGQRPDGRRPRQPMKSFAMKREDAEAVVAYLRSLRPKQK